MGLPSQPITLSVAQIDELNQKLSKMRHDVNNNLGLMIAAVEMIQFQPQMAAKMMNTLIEQPTKITGVIGQFSEEFEKLFGITR